VGGGIREKKKENGIFAERDIKEVTTKRPFGAILRAREEKGGAKGVSEEKKAKEYSIVLLSRNDSEGGDLRWT